MIRNVQLRRLGTVNAGDGGNAGLYTFSNGLSADPRLAPYLQNLTPPQLQDALNGQSPSAADIGAYDQAQLLSCSDNYDPSICGPPSSNPLSSLLPSLGLTNISTWAWLAGGVGIAAIFIGRSSR